MYHKVTNALRLNPHLILLHNVKASRTEAISFSHCAAWLIQKTLELLFKRILQVQKMLLGDA